MKQTKHKRTALFWASVPISAVLLIVAGTNRPPTSVIASARQQEPTTQQTAVNTSGTAQAPEKSEIPAGPLTFHTLKITNNQTLSSLKSTLGEQGIELVLKLNRLDPNHVQKGTTLVVPDAPAALIALSPFPPELEMGLSLPKLILVSREAQAFGAYESGKLVYWGPTSTGKKSTQTPAGLYYTNWKKKETRSTVNPAWILPWAFNLDNLGGIAFHPYVFPVFHDTAASGCSTGTPSGSPDGPYVDPLEERQLCCGLWNSGHYFRRLLLLARGSVEATALDAGAASVAKPLRNKPSANTCRSLKREPRPANPYSLSPLLSKRRRLIRGLRR
jgi:lipoprotein-anchoring transpeptidase ErfK/SrfK